MVAENNNNGAGGGSTQPPEEKKVVLKEGQVIVDQAMLAKVLEGQADQEKKMADLEAKNAGLEALFEANQGADTNGEKKLRERKNFTPAFRTVTLKKYPIKGDVEKLGYVIGWTNRGAYQKVDRSGIAPQIIDYIDIVFLGQERDAAGKLEAESVPLLSLINAQEVNCKVLEMKDYAGQPFRLSYPPTGFGEKKMPTGEAIRITSWDPQHGLVETGEEIDGWVGFTDLTLVIQIPGVQDPLEIDQKYVNV